jgi:hypothetical protein
MSTLRADTIADAAGTGPVTLTDQYASKVYGRFDNTGGVSESLNVASITDDGTGLYTASYTNNMSSTTYGYFCQPHSDATGGANLSAPRSGDADSASSITVQNHDSTGSVRDPVTPGHNLLTVGDLA